MNEKAQRSVNGLYELTDSGNAEAETSAYYNKDLAPTKISERTWNTYHIAMLWVGMSIAVPNFAMASSLISVGMSPWLAILTVLLGSVIILIPIQLNSHAGTKYGLPFPIFARLSFGTLGGHLPSILRALVACGWNAIQSWIGGKALVAIAGCFVPSVNKNPASVYVGFAVFLFLTWLIAVAGSEYIKYLEAIGSPVLIVLVGLLFVWSLWIAKGSGYGFADLLAIKTDMTSIAENGGFMYVFLGGITASIAWWASMALNIPDFSRYAKSQKSQFWGQLYGMPIMMTVCAFVGVVFGMATKVAYGKAIFDPTEVLTLIDNKPITILCAIGVILATLTTNIAANVMAPANGISNIFPKKISYRTGVTVSCLIAVAFRPWWIYSGAGSFVYGWLNIIGGILSPVAAIFIADYYFKKKTRVDLLQIFKGRGSKYWYKNGINSKAVIAWVCGFLLPTLGSLHVPGLSWISANGYIFGFVVSYVVYMLLMKNETSSDTSEEEFSEMTENDDLVSEN